MPNESIRPIAIDDPVPLVAPSAGILPVVLQALKTQVVTIARISRGPILAGSANELVVGSTH